MDLATNPQALAQALGMVTANDSDTIKQGEAALKQFSKKSNCVEALCMYCGAAQDAGSRLQAALLLKKNVAKHFKKFDGTRLAQLKPQLLLLMTQEPTKAAATALAGCVAKLAKVVLGAGGAWPELFGLLSTLGQDPNEATRALNFNLLGQMAEHLPDKLRAHMGTIAQMLTAGCQDPSNVVKKAAMLACSMFLTTCGDFDEVMQLQVILTPMLTVMNACLQNGDEDSACEGLEVVMECAGSEKPLINDHLETLVPFLIAIMQAPNLEYKTKSSANQAIMNIVESRPKLLAAKNLVVPILTSVAQIIAASEGSALGSLYTMPSANLDDGDAKEDDEDESYEEEMEATQQAQIILNVMALNIPDKFFTEPALTMAAQCMSNPDPKMRKAGTAIIGIITEGKSDGIKPLLDRIMPAMIGAMADPDSSVRECACFALGQFSEHLQPDILHHNQVMFPAVAATLEDPMESVRNIACYVLEMFVENLQKETLRPHLPRLMQQLATLLRSESKRSQEMALSGIGAVAVAAESDFAPYTPGICNLLTQLIGLTEPKQLSLRGRALECLGHIAVAVEEATFAPYFEVCMHSALHALTLNDDALKEHSYVFFANSAKVMGPSGSFARYLPTVVPTLIEVVNESELVPGDDDESDDDDDEVGSQDLGDHEENGDTTLFINCAEGFVNGKKAALTALGACAEHCGAHFGPYLEATVKAVLDPEIQASIDSDHEVIKTESFEVLRYMFENLCKLSGIQTERPAKSHQILQLPDAANNLGCMILNQCLLTIEADAEKKTVAAALETVGYLIDTASASLLMLPVDTSNDPEKPGGLPWAGPIGGLLIACLEKLLQEKSQCQKKTESTEDEDDDHDNQLIDSVSDLIGTLAKQMGPGFETYFDRMLPLLLKYCSPKRPYSDLSMAMGCFGEVVAELGPNSIKYQGHLLPIAQAGLAHQMEGVRRNAAFLIGQMVESTGTALGPYFSHILSWMHPVCVRPESKKTLDAGGADVDNAISAVARMIRASRENVPLPQVLPVLLAAMPLQSDFTEGINIFTCLMELLQTGDATAMGQLPQILVTFAHSLVPDSKYEDDAKEAVKVFLRSHIALPHMQEAMSRLPPEVHAVFAEALR